jgi:gliding motility-associated-like protein
MISYPLRYLLQHCIPFFACVLITSSICTKASAQIICVNCFPQQAAISPLAPSLVINGSLDTATQVGGGGSLICPQSLSYGTDVSNWLCTGGGPSTYAVHSLSGGFIPVVHGSHSIYLGNYFCKPCTTTTDDTSCVIKNGCDVTGIPAGYPTNTVDYGNNAGVSLEQTVNGLTIGSVYILEFWTGGEEFGSVFANDGVFALDIGFGQKFYVCKPTDAANLAQVGLRYTVEFRATATSHTIKFTNYGHICSSCTEVILDDIRLYKLSDASSLYVPCSPVDTINTVSIDTSICEGNVVIMNNKPYNTTGIYKDSIIYTPTRKVFFELDLTVFDCYDSTIVDSTICIGDTIVLNGYTFYTTASYADTTVNSPFDNDILITNVTVEPCYYVDSLYIYVPNAFSPNGDNNNELFKAQFGDVVPKSYRMLIYNRYGEKVFESDDLTEGWNGKYKGKDSESTTYFYYIEFLVSGKIKKYVYKGDLILLR